MKKAITNAATMLRTPRIAAGTKPIIRPTIEKSLGPNHGVTNLSKSKTKVGKSRIRDHNVLIMMPTKFMTKSQTPLANCKTRTFSPMVVNTKFGPSPGKFFPVPVIALIAEGM
jgi:hypothetical protein